MSATKRRNFTAAEVIAIRDRYGNDDQSTYESIAKEYGVSALTINLLVRGKTWANIPGALPDNRSRGVKRGPQHPHSKLTLAQVREMVRRYDTDYTLTYGQLAKEHDVSRRVIAHTFSHLHEWLTPEELAGRESKRVRGARRGEQHPSARLDDVAIRHMRTLRQSDKKRYTLSILATMFDTCPSMVSRVIRGLSRLDAGGPIEGK